MGVDRHDSGPFWCVVANVAQETRRGPGGAERRRGTKHFAPGTKVYCFPAQWGDGYRQIKVIGRHRGASRMVEMAIPARVLVNWRVKRVHSPALIERLRGQWDGSDASKAKAEAIASEMSRLLARQAAGDLNWKLEGPRDSKTESATSASGMLRGLLQWAQRWRRQ